MSSDGLLWRRRRRKPVVVFDDDDENEDLDTISCSSEDDEEDSSSSRESSSKKRQQPRKEQEQFPPRTALFVGIGKRKMITTRRRTIFLLLFIALCLIASFTLFRNHPEQLYNMDNSNYFPPQNKKKHETSFPSVAYIMDHPLNVAEDSYFLMANEDFTIGLRPLLRRTRQRPRRRRRQRRGGDEQQQPQPQKQPDYGGLEMVSVMSSKRKFRRRRIKRDDDELYHRERKMYFRDMDEQDDKVPETYYDDLDYTNNDDNNKCITPTWVFLSDSNKQNCNNIHEELTYHRLPSSNSHHQQANNYYDVQYLSHGHFRDTFLFTQQSTEEKFVVKSLRYWHDFTLANIVKNNIEAMLMEQLTSSPDISNLYGHCGPTTIVEYAYELKDDVIPYLPDINTDRYRGRVEQEVLDEYETNGRPHPMNKLSSMEKLDMAIAIVESIAELHGYTNGVIVHDDVYLDQWMKSAASGRVILNDLNNAHILPIDSNGKYCEIYSHYPDGTVKAPEVFHGSYVKEQVDIWPLGNIIFSLLTGLEPYYDETDEKTIKARILKGRKPYLNPAYRDMFIEGHMADIMDQCHELDPNERIDIFEMVDQLKWIKKSYMKRRQEPQQQQQQQSQEQRPQRPQQQQPQQRRRRQRRRRYDG